jgi:hypothetical protein
MSAEFNRQVVPEDVLRFVRACQARAGCHLGGGAALSGAYLGHRFSQDIDLMCHDRADMRRLAAQVGEIAVEAGGAAEIVQDAGSFVRASLRLSSHALEVDLVFEGTGDLEPPTSVEGVLVESLADIRAAKLTCILSRSEPRDLVDLLFLDRAGFPPERDIALALRKDAGIDPRVLGWLLGQFPTEPLPRMVVPLSVEELRAFRDALRERIRAVTVPR